MKYKDKILVNINATDYQIETLSCKVITEIVSKKGGLYEGYRRIC